MTFNSYLQKKFESNPQLKVNLLYKNWLRELGIHISDYRKEMNYSQKDLANKMVVPQSVIARIESGHNMTCSTLWSLSHALGVELEIFGASTLEEEEKLERFATISPEDIPETTSTVGSAEYLEIDSTATLNFNFSNHEQTACSAA